MRIAFALSVAVLAISSRARAGDLEACNGALVRGQELAKAGKLLEARAEYPACVRAECDSPIRAVCANFLSQVSTSIPTLSLEARAQGHTVPGAVFFVDGARVADATRPLEVDPGEHRVKAEAVGYSAHEERVIAVERHGQAVVVTLVPESRPPARLEGLQPGSRAMPASAFVLAGVAVLAAGSFAYFGLSGRSTEHDLRDSCPAGPCDSSTMRRQYLIADISALAGLLAGGGALWIALTRERPR